MALFAKKGDERCPECQHYVYSSNKSLCAKSAPANVNIGCFQSREYYASANPARQRWLRAIRPESTIPALSVREGMMATGPSSPPCFCVRRRSHPWTSRPAAA
jgi:hypothetical protein